MALIEMEQKFYFPAIFSTGMTQKVEFHYLLSNHIKLFKMVSNLLLASIRADYITI